MRVVHGVGWYGPESIGGTEVYVVRSGALRIVKGEGAAAITLGTVGERGMELRRQRKMLEEVPRADVVITNPTHYAVALLYDVSTNQAPVSINAFPSRSWWAANPESI